MTNESMLFEIVENLVLRRKWILKELKVFEEKYGINSNEFYSKWKQGLIPEPEDPVIHGDFMTWEGLVEELNYIECRLKKMLVKV